MNRDDTNIVEVFSGIQGEGVIVGYRQIFVRFANCQLDCAYCDTDFAIKQHAKIEMDVGKRNFAKWENPISYKKLSNHLVIMNKQLTHHSVSLTGGEPLLHSNYLLNLLPNLRENNLNIYLETNGLLYEQLQQIIDYVDLISMDIKLESATGKSTDWDAHERFLNIAKTSNCFVKVVVSNETTIDEISKLANVLTGNKLTMPVIIQPMTPTHGFRPPQPEQLLMLMDTAIKLELDVRVIPQTHVMLNQL